jgi:antitoxin component YwqK of YwqJK toxin-antitoxin module
MRLNIETIIRNIFSGRSMLDKGIPISVNKMIDIIYSKTGLKINTKIDPKKHKLEYKWIEQTKPDTVKPLYAYTLHYLNKPLKTSYFDLPTTIFLYNQGFRIRSVVWKKNDSPHRDNNPAHIVFYPDGAIKQESWYKDGEIYRDAPGSDNNKFVKLGHSKPAVISYYENGVVEEVEYYVDGGFKLSQNFYPNGNIESETSLDDYEYVTRTYKDEAGEY